MGRQCIRDSAADDGRIRRTVTRSSLTSGFGRERVTVTGMSASFDLGRWRSWAAVSEPFLITCGEQAARANDIGSRWMSGIHLEDYRTRSHAAERLA